MLHSKIIPWHFIGQQPSEAKNNFPKLQDLLEMLDVDDDQIVQCRKGSYSKTNCSWTINIERRMPSDTVYVDFCNEECGEKFYLAVLDELEIDDHPVRIRPTSRFIRGRGRYERNRNVTRFITLQITGIPDTVSESEILLELNRLYQLNCDDDFDDDDSDEDYSKEEEEDDRVRIVKVHRPN